MIEGKRCTILWHVDDLKMFHFSEHIMLDELITDDLNQHYGKITPLTVTKGTKHDYLGMTLDYSVPGEVTIHMDIWMTMCRQEILVEALANMSGTTSMPAGEHLFDISDDPAHLSSESSELVCHLTTKLLFLCKQVWPKIQPPVAFLMMRVKQTDTNDYKKLTHVIKYLHATPELP